MRRATGVHKGWHSLYLENHKTVLWTGSWWVRRVCPAKRRGKRIPGQGDHHSKADEWGRLARSGIRKKNCTKYKRGGLKKRPKSVKGPLFLKESSPGVTALMESSRNDYCLCLCKKKTFHITISLKSTSSAQTQTQRSWFRFVSLLLF